MPVSSNVLDDCVSALFSGNTEEIEADIFTAAELEVRRHCNIVTSHRRDPIHSVGVSSFDALLCRSLFYLLYIIAGTGFSGGGGIPVLRANFVLRPR